MKSIYIIVFALLISSFAFGQASNKHDQYIKDELLDFSLVLKYRDSIKLTDNQRIKLEEFYKKGTFDFEGTTKKYNDQLSKLELAIDNDESSEDILDIFNKVLDLEGQLKKNKLGFLLHSKNILSEAQRNQLRIIGRSKELTIKRSEGDIFNLLFEEVKPIIKLVNADGKELYISESKLKEIDPYEIESIDVMKGVDIKINNFYLDNKNMITIKTKQAFDINQTKININNDLVKADINKDPLYVIIEDGKETVTSDGGKLMKQIKPDSIKSIVVLKGEAAKAQYGEKGTNGVVIITLKK